MRCVVTLVISLFLPACILVPVFDSIKKAGFSEGDRQALLPERLKKFHDSLYWSSPMDALQYVEESRRSAVLPDLQRLIDGHRIVEYKVKGVEFTEDAYSANVDVTIRSYKVPVYVVQDNVESQVWKFSLSDGWQFNEFRRNKDKQ